MLQREVVVNSENGLHLRPGSLIARVASQFQCEVIIRNGQKTADARSPLDLMSLMPSLEVGSSLKRMARTLPLPSENWQRCSSQILKSMTRIKLSCYYQWMFSWVCQFLFEKSQTAG